MKIFAKRKRKTGSSTTRKERDSFASDPVVEDLLKKDPKEWNSKERRMIKRYEKRRAMNDETNNTAGSEEKNVEDVYTGNESRSNDDNDEAQDSDDYNAESDESSSSSNTDSGSDDTDKNHSNNEDGDKRIDSLATEESSAKMVINPKIGDENLDEKNEMDGVRGEKIDPGHEIFKIIEKLNSKTKRTLTRKLKRGGQAVLEEVVTEAKTALDESNAPPSEPKKRGLDESRVSDDSGENSSKKKRKKEFDWSSLPAEERLRREEQRRKQQEAADLRARGEDKTPGYKHPLNSERRRANKRKPKWKSSPVTRTGHSIGGVKNEHDHSGYLHRKQVY